MVRKIAAPMNRMKWILAGILLFLGIAEPALRQIFKNEK